ncbi:hypothetical protein IJ556_00650 [bacterium]|nr:hypothetical protein [bacterium]MBR2273337.1 hypothetical protein [Alphaproteobacteria bacterium]
MQKIIRIERALSHFDENLTEDCYALADTLETDFCRKFIDCAAHSDKIVLFYGHNAEQCCLNYQADGVILDFGDENLVEKMSELRQKLGKNKFVGLFSRNRKHEAMLVSEAEPDFVVFKVWKDGAAHTKELIDWYTTFFLIQCAAWLVDDGVEESVYERADFVVRGLL